MKTSKNLIKVLISTLLLMTVFINTAFASTSLYKYQGTTIQAYAPNGAEFEMDQIYTTNPSNILIRVRFYSPQQVQATYTSLTSSSSSSTLGDAVKLGAETAVSAGIDKAKAVILAKYGATILAKAVPVLSAFSWAYTAYEFINIIGRYITLLTLEDAIASNTGLIYVDRSIVTNQIYKWNGSTQFGSYPYAILDDDEVGGYVTIY
jgi:hypothetical protein